MIEHLMRSSLSGDEQGRAAGLIWLHVEGLSSESDQDSRTMIDPAVRTHGQCW